jgi:hypothetical protein
MMRTTPWRRTTLHFTQIFRTDDLTFTFFGSSGGFRPTCRLAEPLILHENHSKSYRQVRLRTIRPRAGS